MRILFVLCVILAYAQQTQAQTFEKDGCQVQFTFTSSENPLAFNFRSRFTNQSNNDLFLLRQRDCDLSYIMFTTNIIIQSDPPDMFAVHALAGRDLNGIVIFKSPVTYPDGVIAGISTSMQGTFVSVPEPTTFGALALSGFAFRRRR